MFNANYLFGTWGGADEHFGGGAPKKDLSSLIRDEEEKDLEDTVQDLDELADRLLTQFPAYGQANQSHASAHAMSQQDAERLRSSTGEGDGTDDDSNNKNNNSNIGGDQPLLSTAAGTGTSLVESRLNQHQHPHPQPPLTTTAGRLAMAMPSSSTASTKIVLSVVPNVTTNWDYDEQYLWKAVGEEKEAHEPSRRGGYSVHHKTSGNGRSYLALQEDTVMQQQQQQQWMYGKNINYHHRESSRDDMKAQNAVGHQNSNISASTSNYQGQKQQQFPNNGSSNSKNHPGESAADFYTSKQHWMPDQLCKQCYACDTQFTVFRRRHHCRLCGQVFCSNCSAFFVPSQKKGSSTLRTCQMCHEQVTQKGGLLLDDGSPSVDDGAANNVSDANANNESSTDATAVATGKGHEVAPDGRPIVTDHKTLTIQITSPPKSANKKADPHHPHCEHSSEKETETATATAVVPMVKVDREQHQPGQKHWQAAVVKEGGTTILDQQEQPALSPPAAAISSTTADATKEAKRHLGLTAANHLEMMGASLLQKDAPLLLEEIEHANKELSDGQQRQQQRAQEMQKLWLQKLMTLATRCCATVEPNVKKGDLLDIRPYVKIKVIPGGSLQDCAYLSGVVFRKTVSHKRMAREIQNPKIMLLSGGIEFTRTENRFASLHTLLEQEGKYMEILVGRILKLKPDVLCVGRSVSRRALELLLKANVVLIQHVKSTLMSRISRQTGATIISSTDHIMNQFGAHVLGKCNRFRLVTFRDSVWVDALDHDSDISNATSTATNQQRSIRQLLRTRDLSNHERQAALAANVLGDGVVDGAEAVKCGLAKRGVAQTYVMLEGCPKHLGCSIVLRGASRVALKQIKRVFRFLVNVAYNLRLETCYLKERCARIRPEFQLEPRHIYSSSLCVDYGSPPPGRKAVRPWNGGGGNESSKRSLSGEITAFDHQSILITSVWMTEKTQCCPAEVKGICYYSLQDVSLGQFLRDSCFNLSLKCQNPSCKKSVDDHSLLFVHKDGVIAITVEHMDGPLPPPPSIGQRQGDDATKDDENDDDDTDSPIATWTYCKNCKKVVTPLVYISENTWKFSFGKFLEVFFYNSDAVMNSSEYSCSCPMQTGTMLYFGCGKLAARFSYERVRPLGVYVRKVLPIDVSFHRSDALVQLERISGASTKLFVKFDSHIDKVAKEARSLLHSAANRPEHLQTVLSELNRIGSEVDHAAHTLQEKIASISDKCRRDGEGVVNEALFRFPWTSRRYLFMLTSAWNERLTATGQAISAMKKLASSAALRGDSVIGPNGPILGTEELMEAMRRLRQLNEVYSRFSVTDITTVLPTVPSKQGEEEYDDEFEDVVDTSIDFADGVDADVLASRRRLNNVKPTGGAGFAPRGQLHKSLGTQRSFESAQLAQETSSNSQPRVTPGGAVKSAITRFFNRGGRESDPYTVDLGIFKEGRPRLEPGVNGIVVPVMDEQLSTVIAYSLASTEYARQFKNYMKAENLSTEFDESGRPVERPVDPSTGAQLPSPANNPSKPRLDEKKSIEQRMLVRNKSHIKHTWRDYSSGERGHVTCKFVCTSYWATQFSAVRQVFLSQNFGRGPTNEAQLPMDVEQGYVQTLSSAFSWAASGGKSGASFARSSDDRFVIKCISRTELQMFLDCAPAYFEYLSKAFFHGLPTVLCKIVGVYQIGYHNRETGKRSMEQVVVMQNIFYNRKISRVFDLKGSLRGRFAAHVQSSKEDSRSDSTPPLDSKTTPGRSNKHSSDADSASQQGKKTAGSDRSDAEDTETSSAKAKATGTQLDGDFLEFTRGRPMPLNDRAKSLFHMSIQNDTLFLSIINVLDYSILVGIDEEKMELVVGIIDFMRQYDILKQMERVGKSLPMVVGSEAPTIIQPPLYKTRFTNAMERYFMTVPCKWTTI